MIFLVFYSLFNNSLKLTAVALIAWLNKHDFKFKHEEKYHSKYYNFHKRL